METIRWILGGCMLGGCIWALFSIEAAMKCSDSFLVGRVIPNAPRRLGDKPPYHRSHNISLPEQ